MPTRRRSDTGHYTVTCDSSVVNKEQTMPDLLKPSLPATTTENDARPSKMRRVSGKIRASNDDIAKRRETLRSQALVVKNISGEEGGRVSEWVQGEKEGRKKTRIPVDESGEQSTNGFEGLDALEGAAELLAGLQELNTHLKELDLILQKCKELSAAVPWGCAETSHGGQQRVIEEKGGDNVINMAFSPDHEILDIDMGNAENENEVTSRISGAGGIVGDEKFDAEVIEIYSDSDDEGKEWPNRNCHGSSRRLWQSSAPKATTNGEEEADRTHPHDEKKVSELGSIMISSDEEDRKQINDIVDLGINQSYSGEENLDCNQMTLQVVDNAASSDEEVVPMEPRIIICKPLASMQRYGPYSTRIRKDGKRWRRKISGWTHIKRTYLLYKRFKEVRFERNVDAGNVQSLLRKGRQNEEAGFPDDVPDDDEDSPYEAYRRSSHLSTEAPEPNPDEEELDDLFKEMALHFDKGWESRETVENNGDCSHNYILDESVGWVCEKCGLVRQDIQSIFLPDSTRPKKKAAVVPIEEEEVLDPENKDDLGLSIAKESLSRQTLVLHPYYEERLHPHQKEGIMFLKKNLLGDPQRRLPPGGCILAHAPGTGKSCLTVSFVQSFLTAYPKGRPLIVAPKIMLRPWQNEFEQWTVDDIAVYNLNETFSKGNKRKFTHKERDHDLATILTATPYYKEKLEVRRLRIVKKWLEMRSVLLVSYNLFAGLVLAGLNDDNTGSSKRQICEALLDGPELLILDEGHFPRTKRTKISQALMRVRTNHKILLSGTLFQNNFRELFNLMKLARHNFMSLSPEFAGRLKSNNQKQQPSNEEENYFCGRTCSDLDLTGREVEEQMFMDDIGYKLEDFVEGSENFEEINIVLRKLRALTAPIVHWYTGQILESLPGLCEFVVYLNLTAHQQKLLSRLKCKSSFEEKTRIAEVCIHPDLLKYEENLLRAAEAGRDNASHSQQDPANGVKTLFLFNLLRLCHISGERLLVFCQTLSPLTLVESMLTKILGWSRGREILRLDGTMQSDERQSMIRDFNDGSSRACIMLASITACKEGISLVGASRVVILDVLYNPSVVRQAVSRAFRIGQKKKVYVYRLVAADTKEERIFQAAVQKDWLSRVLMVHSLRMSGNRYHAEKILQVDEDPEDRILRKMLQTDAGNRIDRVCRYHSDFSK